MKTEKKDNPFDGFNIWGAPLGILLALILCAPALAQDSDEYLERRLDELGQRTYPNQKLRGYRGRVTSPDYNVEFQMQQLDKQRAADDQREAGAILEELSRRGRARSRAKMQAEQNARDDESRRRAAEQRAWIASQYQRLEQQRVEQQRHYERMDAQRRETARQQAQRTQDWLERDRQTQERMRQQNDQLWRSQLIRPTQPQPTPPLPGAYFPPLNPVTPPPVHYPDIYGVQPSQQPSVSPYEWD